MFRFPYSRVVNSCEGQEAIQSVLGPMAPSLDALRVFAKTVVDSKPWNLDPACYRLEWNADYEALSDHGGPGRKLCFAVMWDSDVIKPTPPVKRALDIACKALRAAGHTGKLITTYSSPPTYHYMLRSLFVYIFAVIDWVNHKHMEIHLNTVCHFLDGYDRIHSNSKPIQLFIIACHLLGGWQ
jgi:amidase